MKGKGKDKFGYYNWREKGQWDEVKDGKGKGYDDKGKKGKD